MWLRRRLRVTLAMAAILLLVHAASAVTPPTRSDNEPTREPAASLVSFRENGPRAVPPVGWRRTAAGWQHVSTWTPLSVERIPLGERVIAQRDAEPVWLRELTSHLRRTPPGCFALAQLIGVAVLFQFFSGRVTKRVHGASDTMSVSQRGLAR